VAHLDVILPAILAGVGILLVAAYYLKVPYPILLVIGGAGIGFIPGVPDLKLKPELVLLILLPPLLYSAAFFSSLRDLQRNLRPISLLSIGLVLFTTVGVAAIAHALIGMAWEPAFVLGAIVSPTDPVAASAIARRVGAPGRVVTVVEGESLVNDSTALIAYKFAVAAALTGSFSLMHAAGRFALNVGAGIAIGVAVGWVVAEIRRRIEDSPTEITLSLLTPYFAYLPAEAAGVSAVIAAVTAGIWLGWRSPQLISPATRLQTFAVWEVLQFLLNAALFTLVGLALPGVVHNLDSQSASQVARDAVVISVAVIALRFLWVFPSAWLPRWLVPRVRARETDPPWQWLVLVAWSGMRGAVSLAAALALPASVPDRDLIVFLTYAVIAATLLVQGLSLPGLIRALRIEDDGKDSYRENKARLMAARAAMSRVDSLREEEWVRDETAERVRALYEYRQRRFASRFAEDGTESEQIEHRSVNYQRLMHEIFSAQREAIVAMRNEGRITDEIMHRVERDLDLEESRLEV
jgi:CPA1 family monovalent cation:H+ antiporter